MMKSKAAESSGQSIESCIRALLHFLSRDCCLTRWPDFFISSFFFPASIQVDCCADASFLRVNVREFASTVLCRGKLDYICELKSPQYWWQFGWLISVYHVGDATLTAAPLLLICWQSSWSFLWLGSRWKDVFQLSLHYFFDTSDSCNFYWLRLFFPASIQVDWCADASFLRVNVCEFPSSWYAGIVLHDALDSK